MAIQTLHQNFSVRVLLRNKLWKIQTLFYKNNEQIKNHGRMTNHEPMTKHGRMTKYEANESLVFEIILGTL